MTQTGFNKQLADRGYEDYVSLKKNLKHQYKGTQVIEHIVHRKQTTPTSTTSVEFEEKGGLTISDKTSTELTIVVACDTNDNAYDGYGITGHYFTAAGVASTFTVVYDTTATTTEVACAADFYCWNLRDYTPATVLVSSIAVQAGDNVYVGTTGMVAGAEKRLATIVATATYPVVTTLFGAGDVYGLEETNTGGDVGLVITASYFTPWGVEYEGNFTLAANTTTIVRITDSTTGYPVLDFYRRHDITTTALVGKYVAIGYDTDKRVGTVAIDVFYGVIEEANYMSVHSRHFAPSAATGRLFVGQFDVTNSNVLKIATIEVYFTPKGESLSTMISWDIAGGHQLLPMTVELEPATDFTVKIADDGATPVNVTMTCYLLEVEL